MEWTRNTNEMSPSDLIIMITNFFVQADIKDFVPVLIVLTKKTKLKKWPVNNYETLHTKGL